MVDHVQCRLASLGHVPSFPQSLHKDVNEQSACPELVGGGHIQATTMHRIFSTTTALTQCTLSTSWSCGSSTSIPVQPSITHRVFCVQGFAFRGRQGDRKRVRRPPRSGLCLSSARRGAATTSGGVMVSLKMQKRLAASVLNCGHRKASPWRCRIIPRYRHLWWAAQRADPSVLSCRSGWIPTR